MPRITSPTVAEHRRAQLARLMTAAGDIVHERGPDALTLAALAKRAGLSRPSLYVYFSSRDDLVASLCEREVVRWVRTITDRMAAETTPDGQLRVFVEAQLATAHDRGHELALLLIRAGVGTEAQERVQAAHAPLGRALFVVLQAKGITAPELAATLVQGAVASAYEQIRSGADPDLVTTDALRFVIGGIAAMAPPDSPSGDDAEPGGPGTTATATAASGVMSPWTGSAVISGSMAASITPSMSQLFATSLQTQATQTRRRRERASAAPNPVRQLLALSATSLLCTIASFAVAVSDFGGGRAHLVLGLAGGILSLAILATSFRSGVGHRPAVLIAAASMITITSPVLGDLVRGWQGQLHTASGVFLLVALPILIRTAWHAADIPAALSLDG